MARRFHVPQLKAGDVVLDVSQSRHARDVLRLRTGDEVELFDDAGHVADGTIVALSSGVVVHVASISQQSQAVSLTIACAVPKGDRADWMVEKLSELGVAHFVPITSSRSVVVPGKNKQERWQRIATESAKQCRRAGVMRVEELMELDAVLTDTGNAFYLEPDSTQSIATIPWKGECTLLIGPEGGWTDGELEQFRGRGLRGLTLTTSILRIETAAIAASAVVMTLGASNRANDS